MSDRVTIRVDDSTKQEWQTTVENSREYENLSHLIKLAVHREINDQSDTGDTQVQSAGDTVQTTNGELMDKLRELRGDMDEIHSDVKLVKEEVGSPTIPGSTPDGFFEAIPKGEDNAMTEQEILDELDDDSVNLNTVMNLMEMAVNKTEQIKQTGTDTGAPAYYRVE